MDVQGFGDRCRTNRDQIKIRAVMYRSLQDAFTRSGVRWGDCYHEDRGDGVLILVPASVPKELLVSPLPDELAAELDRYNNAADHRTRLRLRVAVHAGEIHHDTHGVAGAAINAAFRMLEADALKAALRDSPESLALIASSWFYDEVIRHVPQSNPHEYRSIRVAVKETRTNAWVHLPRGRGRADEAAFDRSPRTAGSVDPVPRQLPPGVRDFVGRRRELDVLTNLLKERADRGGTVISVITGTAGVGKTALAVHWAHQVRDQFPDGQLYVNLHGYDAERPTAPQQALEAMLLALGVTAEKVPANLEAQSALYRSLLDGRRVLLVLDNAADAEQIRPLLPGAPGCVVVVTGRGDLAGLIARDGAHPIGLRRLAEAEAISLLRRVIGPLKVDTEPAAAADLARRCVHLPLALRVVAERVATRPHLTLTDFVHELAQHNRLDMLNAADPHTAVRTVFSWSYYALPPQAAHMFRLLALHPGPEIGLQAAAALTDTAPASARQLLDLLVRMHLLEETGKDRYCFHELLRCYAAELVETEETGRQRSSAVRRVLAWYLQGADSARRILCPQRITTELALPGVIRQPLTFATHDQARHWCEAERFNLFAAARHAAAAEHDDIAWRLPLALWSFFFLRRPWTDWVATYQSGLDAAKRFGDQGGEAYTLGGLGYAHQDRQNFEASLGCLERSLNIFQEINDRNGEAWALHGTGNAFRGLRRFGEAIERHRQALDLFREIGDRRGEGWALSGLAYGYGSLRLFDEAIGHFRQAFVIARETERRAEGWALHGLGYAHHGLRCFTDAIDDYRQAHAVFREIGDWKGQGETLYNLGKAQLETGRPQAARDSWSRALTILEELQAPQARRVRARLEVLDADEASTDDVEVEAATPSP
ncbi:ATP-binding protein [Actinomadura sp. 3N407]|uniref:ATP-binding protein n=1 Tax=Actinomadura sp. 3N407 TaxID=3457423 RepID=UPI003FCD371A